MANDLAMLFARQMSMGVVPPADAALSTSPPTPNSTSPAPFSAPAAATTSQSYSITQHYHHSSHLAIPASQSMLDDLQNAGHASPEDMLRSQGIDPSSLYPSQLTLFTHAGVEQKARLIELWRISNPSNQGHPHNQTTRPVSGPTQDTDMEMDMDMEDDASHAEPYVLSGYEALAQREYEASARKSQEQEQQTYRPSNDPVYKGQDFWNAPQQQTTSSSTAASTQQEQNMAMENQYGAHEMRAMYFGCGVRRPHWLDLDGEGGMI